MSGIQDKPDDAAGAPPSAAPASPAAPAAIPSSAPRAILRAVLRPFLLVLALLLVLFEDFLWAGMRRLGAELAKFAPWARMEAWIGTLPPYGAGACLLVPFVLLTPLNLLAVHFFAQGDAWAGVLSLAAEKLGAVFIVERVFHAAKPALLTLGWFRICHDWVVRVRARILDAARATAAWKAAKAMAAAVRPAASAAWTAARAAFSAASSWTRSAGSSFRRAVFGG